jgi:hypothetical protein
MSELHDNVWVRRLKHGNEYFAITFETPADTDRERWHVTIYCYCVPGRCDTYCFRWNAREHVLSYFSEGNLSIARAEYLASIDLNKDQVKKLAVEMVSNPKGKMYTRAFLQMLKIISPKSRTTRAVQFLETNS